MESQNSGTARTWETSLQFLDGSETGPTHGVDSVLPFTSIFCFCGSPGLRAQSQGRLSNACHPGCSQQPAPPSPHIPCAITHITHRQ